MGSSSRSGSGERETHPESAQPTDRLGSDSLCGPDRPAPRGPARSPAERWANRPSFKSGPKSRPRIRTVGSQGNRRINASPRAPRVAPAARCGLRPRAERCADRGQQFKHSTEWCASPRPRCVRLAGRRCASDRRSPFRTAERRANFRWPRFLLQRTHCIRPQRGRLHLRPSYASLRHSPACFGADIRPQRHRDRH